MTCDLRSLIYIVLLSCEMWIIPPRVVIKGKLYTGYESNLKIINLGSNKKLYYFSKKIIINLSRNITISLLINCLAIVHFMRSVPKHFRIFMSVP